MFNLYFFLIYIYIYSKVIVKIYLFIYLFVAIDNVIFYMFLVSRFDINIDRITSAKILLYAYNTTNHGNNRL